MTFNYDVIVVGAGHAGCEDRRRRGESRIKDAFDHDGHEQDRPDEL